MASNTNPESVYAAPGVTGVQFDHPLTVPFSFVGDTPQTRVAVPGEHRKKIAICGFASSSRHRMPMTEPDWEIWGLNQLYRHIPRADRWFDIHLNWREDNVEGTDHPKWLSEFPGPIYMSDAPTDIPHVIAYPLQDMIARFGDYFTSTVAYMVAMAITEIDAMVDAELVTLAPGTAAEMREASKAAYERHCIGIFGIDLIVGTEYEDQKACVEYLIGQAVARGITVYLPPETALCKQRWRYGYEKDLTGQLVGMKELRERQAAIRDRKQRLTNELNQLHGRRNERIELAALSFLIPTDRQAADDVRGNYIVAELQTLDGALQESELVTQVLELRSRGGVIAFPLGTT